MTKNGIGPCAQQRRAPVAVVVSTVICIFVFALSSAAQTSTAAAPSSAQVQQNASNAATQTTSPGSSPSQAIAPKVKFNPSGDALKRLKDLKPGQPIAINLCSGGLPTAPATDADGLRMDNESPCQTPTNFVSGGNPPYHFQLDSGSFPPLGMHLGMNGLLYGTPAKPPLGGYKPFSVCAVDMSADSGCHQIEVSAPPTAHAKGGGHHGLIVGSVLAGGAVAGGVVAAKSLSQAATTGSGGSGGGNCSNLVTQCNNLAAECLNNNNASACQQIPSVCTQMCQCEGFSGFNTGTGSCQ